MYTRLKSNEPLIYIAYSPIAYDECKVVYDQPRYAKSRVIFCSRQKIETLYFGKLKSILTMQANMLDPSSRPHAEYLLILWQIIIMLLGH